MWNYLSVLKNMQNQEILSFRSPYLPISEYSDFKRYTKEQFYEDHIVKRKSKDYRVGCHVILTNSNHPLVHELYADYKIEVIQTKGISLVKW